MKKIFAVIFNLILFVLSQNALPDFNVLYKINPIYTNSPVPCDKYCLQYMDEVHNIVTIINYCNNAFIGPDVPYSAWLLCVEQRYNPGVPKFHDFIILINSLCNSQPTDNNICSTKVGIVELFSKTLLLMYTNDIQYNLDNLDNNVVYNDFEATIEYCFKYQISTNNWGNCFAYPKNDSVESLYSKYIDLSSWYQQIPHICSHYNIAYNNSEQVTQCIQFTKFFVRVLVFVSRANIMTREGTKNYNYTNALSTNALDFHIQYSNLATNFIISYPLCINNFSNATCLQSFTDYYKKSSLLYQQLLVNGIESTLSFNLVFQNFDCGGDDYTNCIQKSSDLIYLSLLHQCQMRLDELVASPIPNVTTSEIFITNSDICYTLSSTLIEWARCLLNKMQQTQAIFKNVSGINEIIMYATNVCPGCFFEYCSGNVYTNNANCIHQYISNSFSESLMIYFESNTRISSIYEKYSNLVFFFKFQLDTILNKAIQKALLVGSITDCYNIWSSYFKNSFYYLSYSNVLPLDHVFEVIGVPSCIEEDIPNCILKIQQLYVNELVRSSFYITASIVNYQLINIDNINTLIQNEQISLFSKSNTLYEWRNNFISFISENKYLYVYNFTNIVDFADLAIPYCSFQSCTIFAEKSTSDNIIQFLTVYNLMSPLILLQSISSQKQLLQHLMDFYLQIDYIVQKIKSSTSTKFDLTARNDYNKLLEGNNVTLRILYTTNYLATKNCDLECFSTKNDCLLLYTNCIVKNIFESLINMISKKNNTYTNLVASIETCINKGNNANMLQFKLCIQNTHYYINYNKKLNLDPYLDFVYTQYIYSCNENQYCLINATNQEQNSKIIPNLVLKMILTSNIDYLLTTNTDKPTIIPNTKEKKSHIIEFITIVLSILLLLLFFLLYHIYTTCDKQMKND